MDRDCAIDSSHDVGTLLYATSSDNSEFTYNYFYNYLIDSINNLICETLIVGSSAEAERLDTEFINKFRDYVNYKRIATSDVKYDKSELNENISEELDEFLGAFKIRDKGVC